MNFNADLISRIIRGIIGLVIIITSIINQNWVGLIGALLLLTAITGGCGFGSSSCKVDYNNFDTKKKKVDE